MRKRLHQSALASVGLALATLSGCFWPVPGQGPDRHAHNPAESTIAPDTVASLHEVWSASLDAGPASDPVLSGFGVLASGQHSTYSLAPESGATRWTNTVDPPLSPTQPFVRGEDVLVGRWDPAATASAETEDLDITVTLDARTGDPRGASVGGQLVALRGNLGVFWDLQWFPSRVGGPFWAPELWVRDLDAGTALCCGGFYNVHSPSPSAPPAPLTLGADWVFAAGYYMNDPANPVGSLGNGVRALSTQARPDCLPPYTCPSWGVPLDGSTSTAPVIAYDQGVAFAGTDAGTVYAVDTSSHSVIWSKSVGSAVTDSPGLAGGTLFVPTASGALLALDAETGATEWAATAGSRITQQPAIAGGVVFTGSANGTVTAFDAGGCGAALCAPLWSRSTGSSISGAPAVSAGRLYVGTADGRVVAFAL